jgi:DNA gyrase/topoisomerase IV subunit B
MTTPRNIYDSADVQTLDGLRHIQKRPGMYGCDPFTKQGIYLMLKEILDNSVDEARMDPGNNHVIKVLFTSKGKSFQAIIRDYGRGVPLDKIEPIFTKPGTSGKWGGAYEASGGTHGVGVKVTVAMSKIFCAVSNRRGEGSAILTVQDCNITNHKVIRRNKDRIKSGTVVFFEPDPEHMIAAETFFDQNEALDDIKILMEFISVFVPNVTFEVYEGQLPITHNLLQDDPDVVDKLFDSIISEPVFSTRNMVSPPQYLLKTHGINTQIVWSSDVFQAQQIPVKIKVIGKDEMIDNHLGFNVQFFLTSDFGLRAGNILSAVNMIQIKDKTSIHLTTVVAGIKELLEPYVDDKYKVYFSESYTLPLHTISIVNWQYATFEGQHKNRFTDTNFGRGFAKALKECFVAKGSEFWEGLHRMLAEDIVIKYERSNRLAMDISKSDKNLAFELNNVDCYNECRSNDRSITELVICEGASAGGYVKQMRNIDTQAVFQLRGKPINALQMTFTAAMQNKIYKDLIKVLGTTQSDIELAEFRFGKIVILTDADPDGRHITALLVGILYSINPQLILRGRIIVASPPLYVVKMRNNFMFVRDNKSFLDFRAEAYSAIINVDLVVDSVKRYNLQGEYFRSFCHMVMHIGHIIDTISNKLNIDAPILEQLVHCINEIEALDTAGIAAKLGMDSCIYEKLSNSLLSILGDVDMVIPLNDLVTDVRKYILPELEKVNWLRINFAVTTLHTKQYENEMLSFTEICGIFKTIDKEFGIRRLKGLGDMDKHHLASTCLDPATRTYVNITSLGDVDKIFKLLGVDTDSRKDIVDQNVE